MYILYLDEAGAHGKASYFVLAGLAVFEREIYWFGQDLEAVQHKYFPEKTDPVFFHATRLRTKAGDKVESPWDELTPDQRAELKAEIYDIIGSRSAVLFACAVEMEYAKARRNLHNVTDIPYFAPARDTRLLQYADCGVWKVQFKAHRRL